MKASHTIEDRSDGLMRVDLTEGSSSQARPEAESETGNRSFMSTAKEAYSQADLINGLKLIGLTGGDVVFFQVSHLTLGPMECGSSGLGMSPLLYSAMREVVGHEGTILLPAFSLSFLRNESFDPGVSPSIQGTWSSSVDFLEYFRCLPEIVRSADPILSVAGLGPMAETLLSRLPNTSYGCDCLYERLLKAGAKICCIGVSLSEAPFVHYVEESVGVPFRYKRLFTGWVRKNGKLSKQGWIVSMPIQSENGLPDGKRLATMARSEDRCLVAKVGLGELVSIDCRSFHELICREIARDSWITARGPAADPIGLEINRTGSRQDRISLSENASMEELISALWRLPRDIVSDGYDTALQALSTQVPMDVHQYPTGTECWTWLVPEKWTCRNAWLETLGGRRLFSYEDNPLHVVSYSLPIDREVSQEELFEHLHTHPELHDAIPFVFKYYERDWGLCCTKKMKDSLRDDRYRVVIKSDFSYGALKVGEVTAAGRNPQTFVLCAHLCHPAMVNDGLSGVVVGLKVMQELLKRPNLNYTYRFLILPETIGSVAYLSHHQELIPKMIGGLFLEMLGLENPHALQLSYAGDTEVDRCLTHVLKQSEPGGWTGPFRTVVGNDERQFNAPGVRVPMLSLSRVMQSKPGSWPYYPEYHSSRDNPELTSIVRLAESRDLVLKMIDAVEGNQVPVNRYQGEVFCSRYGLSIDAYANPEGNRALFDIMFLIDGKKSIAEIARICGISVESARCVVEELHQLALVEFPAGG
jgi:aminopeptidase-like protein/aminoglycoside N3'-acetyltransferase